MHRLQTEGRRREEKERERESGGREGEEGEVLETIFFKFLFFY